MINKGTHNYIVNSKNDNIIIFINGKFYNRSNAMISI